MEHDQQQPSPPVVAVVVAREPAPHLEVALRALAAQDAPNITCLVLVSGAADPAPVGGGDLAPGGSGDPSPLAGADPSPVGDADPVAARIGTVLPGAFIRRCPAHMGFADAANEALLLVEGGGGYFCFLHDDVVLDSDAVRHLVDEAVRSNAGIVGPKLVAPDDNRRLLSTGDAADKFGELSALSEPGELDQEQHDAVRDVFALSSACLLVRADLLRALHGFDTEMTAHGSAVDLCWRTHVAGGRVLVVPDARAGHFAATTYDEFDGRLDERSRLRAVFGNYSAAHLARVVPQLVVVTLWQVLVSLVTGHVARARALVGAWSVLGGGGSLRAKRHAVAAARQVPDAEIRRLQMHGSARLLGVIRHRNRGGSDGRWVGASVRVAGRQVADGVRATTGLATTVLAVFAVLVVFGGRSLVTGRVPVVGSLVGMQAGGRGLLRAFSSGWWSLGLGRAGSSPTGMGLLSLASVVTLGNLTALRVLVLLGSLVLGGVGAWRLVRPFGSSLSSVAAFATYAGAPLGVNALGRGHLAGLLAYAATPWMVARVARLGGVEPFISPGPGPGRAARVVSTAAGLALQVAVVSSFAPAAVLIVPFVAVALLLGSFAAGAVRRSALGLVFSVLTTAAGAALVLPWRLVRRGSWLGLGSLGGEIDHWRFARLARFATGPHGSVPLGLAIGVAVVAAVVIARGAHLGWVIRGIVLAAASFAVALLASRGKLGQTPPEIELLLAPALVGLTLVTGAGAAAFGVEARGRTFSWRQPIGFAGALAIVLAVLPTLATVTGGRFASPTADAVAPLRFLPPTDPGAGQRLLWIGSPATLPPSSWRLTKGLAYAITGPGGPAIDDLWSDPAGDGERQVAEAIALAADGQTDRLGHLLAPMGIRFLVLPGGAAAVDASGSASSSSGASGAASGSTTFGSIDPTTTAGGPGAAGGGAVVSATVPAALTGSLAAQLDLQRVKIDERLLVYENTAWLATLAQLDVASTAAGQQVGNESLAASDLSGSVPILSSRNGERASGAVVAGTVYVARPYDDRWSLTVDGVAARPAPAFGWATSFAVAAGGQARLHYATSPVRWIVLLGQLAAWLVLVRLALDASSPLRRRRRSTGSTPRTASPHDPGDPGDPSPLLVAVPERRGERDDLVWAETPAATADVQALRDALILPDELSLRWADAEGSDQS